MRLVITLFLSFTISFLSAQPSSASITKVLNEINTLRSKGCKCGSEWMPPASPLEWNHSLYAVSNRYARYMAKNKHFDHISKEGEDLGDRLDLIGFEWAKIGENLGVGYDDFYSVLEAWIESPGHCRMLMDQNMTDMGLSKHKLYWAQSFSKSPDRFAAASGY